jgi:uncharacterized RDD family membrane protein YckC
VKAISQPPAGTAGPALDNRRVAAGAIDLAVVGAVALVLRAAAGGGLDLALGALAVGWGLFYCFACESAGGQTLGKALLGLRVRSAGGGPADERAIALRTLLRLVDGIGFYVVGLLAMLRSGERRQRLGDSVGGTVVVSATEAPAARPSAPRTEPGRTPAPVPAPEPQPEPEPAAAEPEPQPAPGEPQVEIVSHHDDEGLEGGEEPEPEPEPDTEPEPEPELQPTVAREPGLPQVASPAIEELAGDVAASAASPPAVRPEPPTPEAGETAAPEAADEPEDVSVKSVETVSPMDLVMGAQDERDEPAEPAEHAPSRGTRT